IRDTVLSTAHLNACFIVEVVDHQDGHEPPVAIIANYSGNARVERAGPSPIRIGLVEVGIQYLNARRRTVGGSLCRRQGPTLPVRPQIPEPETGPQQHNSSNKVSKLSH